MIAAAVGAEAAGDRAGGWCVVVAARRSARLVDRARPGTAAITIRTAGGERIATPEGARLQITSRAQASVSDRDPGGARVEAEAEIRLELASGASVEVDARVVATAEREHYRGVVRQDGRVLLDEQWERP